jgi:hypothetical protein
VNISSCAYLPSKYLLWCSNSLPYFLFYFFEIGSYYIVHTGWNLLSSPGWPWTNDPPASVAQCWKWVCHQAQLLGPIFNQVCFLIADFWEFFIYYGYMFFIRCVERASALQYVACLLIFLSVFWRAKNLNFEEVQFIGSFIDYAFGVLLKKIFA